jgi:hypothetical protein
MSVAVYPSPRQGALPFAAATLGIIVCVLALPVVLLVRGPFEGWAIGTGLWIVNWALAQMTTKFALGFAPAAAVGTSGVSVIGRAWLVAIVLFIVAIRISHPVALTAAIVFAAAFTMDLMGRMMLFGLTERTTKTPDHEGPSDS